MAFTVLVSSAITGGGVLWLSHESDPSGQGTPPASQAPKVKYQCPMHPTVVQDHPGDCPICGMKLVKVMDPEVAPRTPKGDERGMNDVTVYADELGASSSTVPGQATVDVDPARQQLIGLTTTEVTLGPVGGVWRTVGRVAVDETGVRHINVKVPGFVERIYVDFVGKKVRKGDPLFALYSPELLSAQEEYLLALRTQRALSKDGVLANDGDALVRGTRRKLALWDISEAEIDRVAAKDATTKTLTFYSPISGVVTKKDVVEGMKVDAGAMLYEITDLSTVWVLADVYESELRFVEEGIPATLSLNAFPNREFRGKALFIDPLLDPQTRTVKVRLAFSNPNGELRPGMFGEVILHGKLREGLRVPQDAVVDSGTEKIVFVALGNGKFQPRVVRMGDASGDLVEVVAGLQMGERVVTRANFLIDSESRLRASLAEMSGSKAPREPESARSLPSSVSQETSPAPAPSEPHAGPGGGGSGAQRSSLEEHRP
jgi:Cu(I)/Ag(I) efflux system membrane fusion protein